MTERKDVYEIRHLQGARPDGVQWGVYKLLDDNHVTAVALCYGEEKAFRIADLLNAADDQTLLAVIDNWRLSLDPSDKEKIGKLIMGAVKRKISKHKGGKHD